MIRIVVPAPRREVRLSPDPRLRVSPEIYGYINEISAGGVGDARVRFNPGAGISGIAARVGLSETSDRIRGQRANLLVIDDDARDDAADARNFAAAAAAALVQAPRARGPAATGVITYP